MYTTNGSLKYIKKIYCCCCFLCINFGATIIINEFFMYLMLGLERIAEELMGRRKWKLYQECMSRNQQQPSSQVHSHPHPITNNINNNNNCIIDSDSKVSSTTTQATQTTATTTTTTTTTTITTVKQEPENDEQERLKDWSPQSKCYFCVDGKLDSDHTTHGALVNFLSSTFIQYYLLLIIYFK